MKSTGFKRFLCLLTAAILLCATVPVYSDAVKAAEDLPLPIGTPNPASGFMFTGQSYVYQMVEWDEVWNADAMVNVSFEPCCRTDWHSHAGGQILIAVGGIGIHQVEGQEPQLLLPGTVARVEPGKMHWHGATEESWFQHIAVETNPESRGLNVGNEVTDEEYLTSLRRAAALSLNQPD